MSPILEVLIGMVFLYSLLSILVTQMNAVIANALKLRARHLRDGISYLVKDNEILAKVLTHPLIDMVENNMLLPEQRIDEAQAKAIVEGALKNVTWIAPENFTNVLLNLVRVHSDQELFGALLAVIDGMPSGEPRRRLRILVNQIINTGQGIEELRELIATLDPSYRDALNQLLTQIDEEIAEMGFEPDANIALMAGLRKLNNPYLRNALETILSTSKTIEEAEKKITEWFNNGMDKASEAFKRTMQYWSLGIGIAIAIVLNVDSLYIAQRLWNDPTLRSTVAIAAQQADLAGLQQREDAAQATTTDEEQPTAGEGGEGAAPQPTTDEVIANLEQAIVAGGTTAEEVSNLRLPLGWSFENLQDVPADDARVGNPRYLWNFVPGNYSGWFVLWLAKVIGLSATMIAIAQGAPFWFGILRRLSGGTG